MGDVDDNQDEAQSAGSSRPQDPKEVALQGLLIEFHHHEERRQARTILSHIPDVAPCPAFFVGAKPTHEAV